MLSENDGADGEAPRKLAVIEGGVAGGDATLTKEKNKKFRGQERNKARSDSQQKSISEKEIHSN